jgi:predicted negative regulator of RcsB-dependent stress response
MKSKTFFVGQNDRISSLPFAGMTGTLRLQIMTTEAPAAIQIERSINWLDANRTKLIQAAIVVVVLVVAVSFYLWNGGQKEIEASKALSNVSPGPGAADSYLKLAGEHSGTVAASRAVLLAAGELFSAGKYGEAQSQFARFEKEYANSPLRIQGLLGVAASLDAQNKTADAIARYEDLIKRHSDEPAMAQARSALARLYEAQNKPELALSLYDDLRRTEAYSSFGLEANIRRMDLLAKHPELAAKAKTSVGGLK